MYSYVLYMTLSAETAQFTEILYFLDKQTIGFCTGLFTGRLAGIHNMCGNVHSK